MIIPQVLVDQAIVRSNKKIAERGWGEVPETRIYQRMVSNALRHLMKCSEPFEFQTLKHYLTFVGPDVTSDIVLYTIYRCRPNATDGGHASFRNEERCLSFEDVVIAIYAESVNALKEHLERRSRSVYGGPQMSVWT